MGGDQGEGENPRVFSSSPPSLVLPTPPKADQPLAERGRKLIVYLNLLRSYVCAALYLLSLSYPLVSFLGSIILFIGSIGLFIILAIVMFVSRHIDWYKIDQ